MKNLFKKSLLILGMFALLLSSFPGKVSAAGASLSGPGTVRAGDTIKLSFNVSGSNIYGVQGTLSYDSSQLTLTSTSKVIGGGWAVEWNGNSFVAYDNNLSSPINSSKTIFTLTFKVNSDLQEGSNVKVSLNGVKASDGSADQSVGSVSYSKNIAAPLSGENNLASLTVSNATISPSFNPSTTSYKASVPYEVDKLSIKATGADKSTVSIDNPTLKVNGTTRVTITVKAENGAKKSYTIDVHRAQDPNYVPSSNNEMKNIEIEGFLLSPVFDANVKEYVVWLPTEVDSINIKATAVDKLATTEVIGNTNLVAGEDNRIQVICKAENGDANEYIIIAKRAEAHQTNDEVVDEPEQEPVVDEPSKPMDFTYIYWVGFFALGLVVGFVVGSKRKK